MINRMRRAVAAAAMFGLSAAAGVAVAQWGSVAMGGSSVTAASAVTVQVSGGAADADLYPGFTAGDLAVRLDNPNPYPVRFTALEGGVVTPSTPACPVDAVRVDDRAVDLLVPAGVADAPAVLADVVSMDPTAPEGCMGATFAIEVQLTGTQA